MRHENQLTESSHIHDHEVAPFRHHRLHADGAQDVSQAVPLPLQFLGQRGEVAVRLAHALVVYHQAMGDCLLCEQGKRH